MRSSNKVKVKGFEFDKYIPTPLPRLTIDNAKYSIGHAVFWLVPCGLPMRRIYLRRSGMIISIVAPGERPLATIADLGSLSSRKICFDNKAIDEISYIVMRDVNRRLECVAENEIYLIHKRFKSKIFIDPEKDPECYRWRDRHGNYRW